MVKVELKIKSKLYVTIHVFICFLSSKGTIQFRKEQSRLIN